MLKYDLSRLKHRVQFGTVKSVPNRNTGDSDETFVPQFTVWCGEYQNSMTQQYTLLGNDQQDNITIVIRHNSKVNSTLECEYNGVLYDVVAVNSDDQINAFDTVTLKKSSKLG